MNNTESNFSKIRVRSVTLTTIISISLVLFLLGILALMLINTKKISDYVKENIGFTLYLKEDVKEVDIIQLKKSLDASRYVKNSKYISKEQAANILKKELGEDFIKFLGYNPLLESIEIKLKAEFANQDSILWIEKEITSNPIVKEVDYQKDLLSMVNDNVKKISIILLSFSGLLFIISFALINNTIRLSIYSKRFLIKTMQLVGATPAFIRRPFIFKGIINGVIAALLAESFILSLIYILHNKVPELIVFIDIKILIILFFIVLLLGIIITCISTFFAVRKYLKVRNTELY